MNDVIPQDWWSALDAQPDCMVLRRALADWLEEQGDTEGAEAIRWSLEKGRVPHPSGWCDVRFYKTPDADAIPIDLLGAGQEYIDQHTDLYSSNSYCKAFIRLIIRWKHCTPEQRAEFWKWEVACRA